jgi:hypothetical protein
MASAVADPATAAAIEQISAGLDALAAAGVEPVDARDAVTVVRAVEVCERRFRSLTLGVQDSIDRRGLHKADGHASAKVMVRHVARLSDGEAARRALAVRMLRAMPAVAAAFAAGAIGACQVDRIARAYANPRVREALVAQDAAFATVAAGLGYREFAAAVTDWVRQADEDGTADKSQRNHDNRNLQMSQDLDGGWAITGRCGSLQGTVLAEILAHFEHAEWLADWEKARAEHGDNATVEHLPRTAAQRRFDAFFAMAQQAAGAEAGRDGGSQIVTNIVIDWATYQRELRRMADAPLDPLDPKFEGPTRWPGPPPDTSAAGDEPDDSTDSDQPEPLGAKDLYEPDLDTDDDPDDEESGLAGHGPPGEEHADQESRQGDGDHESSEDEGDEAEAASPHERGHPSPPKPTPPEPDPPDPPPGRPPDPPPDPPSTVGFRCSTLDGHQIDPTEAAAAALIGHVRRVVVGADGVVIDLGRRRRLFTGPAQLAVMLNTTTCTHPGCHTPASRCQTDHTNPWTPRPDGTGGGPTKPDNGNNRCGRHNLFKENGFRVWRDPAGQWHTYRPDGTEID